MDLDTDFERGAVLFRTATRPGCAPIRSRSTSRASTRSPPARPSPRDEPEILRRRREHLILRVDRADLSKNVLRGFTAFDIFLEQHPEFAERVTFIAHLQPSRQDVPEYVEYLEKIEALVAVINHRHGTTDWMPIDLRLRDDFEEAVALYKHFDLLLVNAMWDGMNLVAKEGPLINTRDGVIMLSENTGAHEELGDCALSVNPFDVQEQADAIHTALTALARGASAPDERLQEIITLARPSTGSTSSSPTSSSKRARGAALAQGRTRRSGPNSARRRDGAGAGDRRRRGDGSWLAPGPRGAPPSRRSRALAGPPTALVSCGAVRSSAAGGAARGTRAGRGSGRRIAGHADVGRQRGEPSRR